jgi:hypothetical protein
VCYISNPLTPSPPVTLKISFIIFRFRKNKVLTDLSHVDRRIDRRARVLDDVGPDDVLLAGQDIDFNLGHRGPPDVVVGGSVAGSKAPLNV